MSFNNLSSQPERTRLRKPGPAEHSLDGIMRPETKPAPPYKGIGMVSKQEVNNVNQKGTTPAGVGGTRSARPTDVLSVIPGVRLILLYSTTGDAWRQHPSLHIPSKYLFSFVSHTLPCPVVPSLILATFHPYSLRIQLHPAHIYNLPTHRPN